MAKAHLILGYLLCVLVFSRAACQDYLGRCDSEPRTQLKRIYEQEIGVREQGGANRGERVEAYLASVGLGPGYAWCAAFVSWCFQQTGIIAPRSAWVPSFAVQSKRIVQRGEVTHRLPQSGDVFLIWFRRLNRPAHTGFVDRWNTDWVVTVEGNTNASGSREGDGVYRKRRLTRQIWAVSNFIDR